MSKTETVRALRTTSPELEIVRSVRTLATTAAELRSSLDALPAAIAVETAKSLEPLETATQEACKAVDRVATAQRLALDSALDEVATKATDQMQKRVETLDSTFATLTKAAQSATTMAASGQQMASATTALIEAAERARTPLWERAVALVAVGIVAGVLVLTGAGIFERLVPPGDALQKAAAWDRLEQTLTPAQMGWVSEQVGWPPAK